MSPQCGWLCVFGDDKKTFSECIACSKTDNHCEFTPEMLTVMRRGKPEKRIDALSCTPSKLLAVRRCSRQIVLKDRNDYWTSPRRGWFLLRGNLLHGILEGIFNKDAWSEIMQYREIDIPSGKTIRIWGKSDKIVREKLLIVDYKTTARIPTKKQGVLGDHDWQLNFYRWLWWDIFQAEKLRLQYIDMRGTKQVKVDIIPIEEVVEEIRRYADLYYRIVIGEGVPAGRYDEKNWVCRFCDVQDICRKLNRGGKNGQEEPGEEPGEEAQSSQQKRSRTTRKRGGKTGEPTRRRR